MQKHKKYLDNICNRIYNDIHKLCICIERRSKCKLKRHYQTKTFQLRQLLLCLGFTEILLLILFLNKNIGNLFMTKESGDFIRTML